MIRQLGILLAGLAAPVSIAAAQSNVCAATRTLKAAGTTPGAVTPAAGEATRPPRAPALTDFGLGAQVLAHLGARSVRLLTNHPRRIVGLAGYGIEVVECLPIRAPNRVVPLRDAGDAGGGKRSA